MDIMMRNVPWAATDADVTIAVAGLLHSDTMQPHIPREIVLPLNFRVFLHPKRPNHDPKRGQTGILTVPAASIGAELLRLVSHVFPILVHNRRVWFSRSVKEMRPGVVEELRRTPFVDPFQAKAMEQKQAQLQDDVRVHTLQFGRRCRDDVFSSEWEHRYVGNEKCSLRFQDATTELYIQGELVGKNAHAVVIRYSNIETIEVDNRPEEPSILFSLNVPPAFEEVDPTEKKSRKRTTYLGDPTLEHALVAPFTSTVVRLVCRSIDDLASFKHMSKVARLRKSQKTDLMIERRHLFSTFNMQLVERWLRSLDWGVAFQCASLLQSSLLDAVELLQCRHDIAKLPSTDVARNVYVLRCFGTNLKTFLGDDERESAVQDPVAECFAAADASVPSTYSARQVATDDLFACLHVTFTPTRIILHGPEPDQARLSCFNRYYVAHTFTLV
jgi:RNA-dependent RNA polymerase